MTRAATFADILDQADRLPLDEKQELIDVLQRRAAEQRRKQIVREVAASEREHRKGQSKVGTASEIIREIIG